MFMRRYISIIFFGNIQIKMNGLIVHASECAHNTSRAHQVKMISNFVCVLFCVIVTLSGCAVKSEMINNSTQLNKEIREEKNVLTEKWVQPSQNVEAQEGWEVVEYIADTIGISDESVEIDEKFISSDNQNLYVLTRCEAATASDVSHEYWWKRYDLTTMEYTEKRIFTKQDFENVLDLSLSEDIVDKIKNGYARVTSVDVCGNKNCVFLTVWNEIWEIRHFYMFQFSFDGKIESATDYVNDVWPDGKDRIGQFGIPMAYCGNDGTIYLLYQQTLRQIGENRESEQDIDLSCLNARTITFSGKGREGIPVFCAWLKKNEKVFFCAKDGELHYLWQGDLEATTCRLDQYGYMLMLQDDRLMTWNVLDGEMNCLYQFTGLSAFSCADIVRNSSGEIVMWYDRGGENGFAYRLNDSDHPDMKELVLMQSFQDEYTAKCAADYTRTHPGIKIIVEQMEDTGDNGWNKLGINIANGQGPDLILANRQQISILKDAGGLTCLTNLISDSTKESIFSGALRFGMFDEELYALPYEASLGTWMIRKDLIPNDNWNLEGVMNAFEEWKKQNPNAKRFEGIYFHASSTQLLYDMCLQNLENCEFVDLNAGKCNFNTDSFTRLLKFCYENGENTESDHFLTKDEQVQDMIDDKTFLYYMGGGLVEYSNARSALGEQYVAIGYPSDKKVLSMIHCYRGVAVNEKSTNKDIAVDFLLSMISEESQVYYTTYWIRKDVLTERVKNDNGDGSGPFFKSFGRSIVPLKGKKDGMSFLDEYMTLMDEGEPLTIQYSIRDIVVEEAGAYFAGEKKESEVADIIQKRVQNYLDEQ